LASPFIQQDVQPSWPAVAIRYNGVAHLMFHDNFGNCEPI